MAKKLIDMIDMPLDIEAIPSFPEVMPPGHHVIEIGWNRPAQAFFSSEEAKTIGFVTWLTPTGEEINATSVRIPLAGVMVIECDGEKYVGDVVGCIRTYDDNKKKQALCQIAGGVQSIVNEKKFLEETSEKVEKVLEEANKPSGLLKSIIENA